MMNNHIKRGSFYSDFKAAVIAITSIASPGSNLTAQGVCSSFRGCVLAKQLADNRLSGFHRVADTEGAHLLIEPSLFMNAMMKTWSSAGSRANGGSSNAPSTAIPLSASRTLSIISGAPWVTLVSSCQSLIFNLLPLPST
jgi:hypothetical protein